MSSYSSLEKYEVFVKKTWTIFSQIVFQRNKKEPENNKN